MQSDLLPPYVTTIIGWLFVLLGLLYNNRKNNEREFRKEERATLDKLIKDIDELTQRALEFHTSSELNYQLSERVLGGIQRVARSISRLSFYKNQTIITMTKEFRQKITFKNFNIPATDFRYQAPESDTALEIIRASLDLVDSLEDSYYQRYNRNRVQLNN